MKKRLFVFLTLISLLTVRLTAVEYGAVFGAGLDTSLVHPYIYESAAVQMKVNDMFYDVARLRDDTSIQAKIYCSDATWTWLTTGLVEGVHPTTGFNIYRFAHITE